MRGKDDLFHLIKAMSKSEKRYFTLDAKKSGKEGAKYLNLFQLINGMNEYNEAKLKTKIKKNLSSDKGYLYEAILRSMRDYRSAKSRAAQIKERIMDSRYLYERGLYSQFEDRLQEAKSMVKELDDNFTLLEIIREEQHFKQNIAVYNPKYLKDIDEINKGKDKIVNGVIEELKYLDLYSQLFLQLSREFELKDEARKKELEDQTPGEIKENGFYPESPRAKLRLLKCKVIYSQLMGAYDEVYQNSNMVLDWWEEYPKIKDEEFFKYLIDVSNHINICFKSSKYRQLLPEFIKRIENEKPKNFHEQALLFKLVSMRKLLYYFSINDFQSAKPLIPEIDQGIKKFNLKDDIVLTGNVAILYFVTSDFLESQKWFSRILQIKNEERKDIQRMARLLYLISCFETEDIDSLESAVRAMSRFLKKREISSSSFEAVIFKQLKKLFFAPIGQRKTLYKDIETVLLEFKNNPKTQQTLGLDVLLRWVSGKI